MDIALALAGLGLYYYVFFVFDVAIINDIDLDFCLALLLQHAESNRFQVLSQCCVGVGLGILAFKFVVALVLACTLGLCSHAWWFWF
jgi:hypothetical protein